MAVLNNHHAVVTSLARHLALDRSTTELQDRIDQWVEASDAEGREPLRWQLSAASKFFRPLTVFACHRAVSGAAISSQVMRAMLETIEPDLPRGAVVVSVTVSADVPEGTLAPGLAEAMRAVNPAAGRLSRGVAGTVGTAIVLNTPGSSTGAAECLTAVIDVLPHALALLLDLPTSH